ncbi:MAG: ABC transporter permease [Saccharofermentans sp.]|nr:ABC transporter permease [Saccharofermentans sp.]
MGFIDWIKQFFLETGSSYKRGFKKLVFAAPFWVILISIVLLCVGFIQIGILKQNRKDQNMADYWQQGSNMEYREMSVFARGARSGGETTPLMYVDQTVSLKKADIVLVRTALQTIVDSGSQVQKDKGLDKEGNPVGWEDCYSSTIKSNVATIADSSENEISVNADCEIVAVGGNYQIFHPFRYLSGGFLPEVCTDANQIVLNDVLAWRFFNSDDVIGSKVTLWGQTFTVIGVVSEPSSSIDKKVDTTTPRAYVYFSAMEKYTVSGDESEDISSEYAIQCYQAMLPEIVKGVAVNDLKTALPTYTETNPQMYVVSNTDRYGVLRIWDDMVPLGEKAGILSNYELPYWERAAWLTTQYIFAYIVVITLGFILLFIGIIMIVMHFKKIDKTELQHSDSQIEM